MKKATTSSLLSSNNPFASLFVDISNNAITPKGSSLANYHNASNYGMVSHGSSGSKTNHSTPSNASSSLSTMNTPRLSCSSGDSIASTSTDYYQSNQNITSDTMIMKQRMLHTEKRLEECMSQLEHVLLLTPRSNLTPRQIMTPRSIVSTNTTGSSSTYNMQGVPSEGSNQPLTSNALSKDINDLEEVNHFCDRMTNLAEKICQTRYAFIALPTTTPTISPSTSHKCRQIPEEHENAELEEEEHNNMSFQFEFYCSKNLREVRDDIPLPIFPVSIFQSLPHSESSSSSSSTASPSKREEEKVGHVEGVLKDIFVVGDASKVEMFSHLAGVQTFPFINFFAAAPIQLKGQVWGYFCIMDPSPRTVTSSSTTKELQHLLDVSHMVADIFEEQHREIYLMEDEMTRLNMSVVYNLKHPLELCAKRYQQIYRTMQEIERLKHRLHSIGLEQEGGVEDADDALMKSLWQEDLNTKIFQFYDYIGKYQFQVNHLEHLIEICIRLASGFVDTLNTYQNSTLKTPFYEIACKRLHASNIMTYLSEIHSVLQQNDLEVELDWFVDYNTIRKGSHGCNGDILILSLLTTIYHNMKLWNKIVVKIDFEAIHEEDEQQPVGGGDDKENETRSTSPLGLSLIAGDDQIQHSTSRKRASSTTNHEGIAAVSSSNTNYSHGVHNNTDMEEIVVGVEHLKGEFDAESRSSYSSSGHTTIPSSSDSSASSHHLSKISLFPTITHPSITASHTSHSTQSSTPSSLGMFSPHTPPAPMLGQTRRPSRPGSFTGAPHFPIVRSRANSLSNSSNGGDTPHGVNRANSNNSNVSSTTATSQSQNHGQKGYLNILIMCEDSKEDAIIDMDVEASFDLILTTIVAIAHGKIALSNVCSNTSSAMSSLSNSEATSPERAKSPCLVAPQLKDMTISSFMLHNPSRTKSLKRTSSYGRNFTSTASNKHETGGGSSDRSSSGDYEDNGGGRSPSSENPSQKSSRKKLPNASQLHNTFKIQLPCIMDESHPFPLSNQNSTSSHSNYSNSSDLSQLSGSTLLKCSSESLPDLY